MGLFSCVKRLQKGDSIIDVYKRQDVNSRHSVRRHDMASV